MRQMGEDLRFDFWCAHEPPQFVYHRCFLRGHQIGLERIRAKHGVLRG
jgi:hypothetical protein